MQRALQVVLMVFALSASHLSAGSTIDATTPDGRKVILSDDGTWKFKDQGVPEEAHASVVKPPGATEVIKSKKGFFELWYNPDKWTARQEANGETAEFKLAYSKGDAYVMAIVERIGMPPASLRKLAFANAKAAAPDAKVVLDESRVVNGVTLTALQMEGTVQGIPFKYYGYYWTGKAGTLQLIAYTSQNLFDDVAADFTELLNGAVITKE